MTKINCEGLSIITVPSTQYTLCDIIIWALSTGCTGCGQYNGYVPGAEGVEDGSMHMNQFCSWS